MSKTSSRYRPRGQRISQWVMLGAAAITVAASLGCLGCACGGRLDEARRLEDAGDWQAALAVYEDVLGEDPNDLEALSGAAVALWVLQRFDEALELQERVVAADPADAQTRVELAFNYLNHQDRPVDAVRVLEEAVELDPSAKNLTFLAQALEEAGDVQEAEGTLRRALDTDADYAYAYSQLVRLLKGQGRYSEAETVLDEAAARGVAIDAQ